MRSISVRDLRHKWPEAEAALKAEGEIIVTRDSKPVAKLVHIPEAPKRKRWDPEEHARWQRKVSGGKLYSSDKSLAELRANREFK
jgi:antitoxin (DNA-binding transcriptional repressor) of toxin-antitoxin stability system